jgi:Mg2+-importing ATPase
MADRLGPILPRQIPQRGAALIRVAPEVLEAAHCEAAEVYGRLRSAPGGLSSEEAQRRRHELGPNVVVQERRFVRLRLLGHALINPLVILLLILAALSVLTDDLRAATVMLVMVVLGVALRFIQEARADSAAAKLKAMISVTATGSATARRARCPWPTSSPATWTNSPPAT